MRILHTADWHLGNTMHDVDRRKEQEGFLDWLLQVVKVEKIDTLIVAGDIFDTYGPPNWAMKIYYAFLAALHATDCRNVILVGGNHDSGNLLDAPEDLLSAFNIHMVGNAANKSLKEMVFELKDSNGEVCAICAALPFVTDIYLSQFCENRSQCEDGKFSDIVYSELYKELLVIAEKKRNGRDIPIITTGHLYAAGLEGRYEGAEKETGTDDGVRVLDVVGNLGKVHVNSFPDEFDYVALGHIHYSTTVGKNKKVRYSGSPFVMGFDESEIPHHVLLAYLNEDGEPLNVKAIETPCPILYKRLSGSLEDIQNQLANIIDRASAETPDHEQYCVELYYSPSIAMELRDYVDELKLPQNVKICSWNVKRTKKKGTAGFEGEDIKSLRNIGAKEIFRQLVYAKSNIEREGLTDEEYKKKLDEEYEKLLPFYMKAIEKAKSEANVKNVKEDDSPEGSADENT